MGRACRNPLSRRAQRLPALWSRQSICLNFGLAEAYGGACMRFDDTSRPRKSRSTSDAIIEAVQWMGFDWQQHLYFASDYFDKMYAMANT